jgi:hypothetical protein
VPNVWIALHSSVWPQDVQQRSYFTDRLCGAGTDRACPGPAVPNVRNDNGDQDAGSAYITPEGRLVWPARTVLLPVVPFQAN